MEDMKLPMISKQIYDEVESIVERGKLCGSKKAVQPYISQLDYLRIGLPTRASYKIGEIISCLKEYCNIRSDKYMAEYHLYHG